MNKYMVLFLSSFFISDVIASQHFLPSEFPVTKPVFKTNSKLNHKQYYVHHSCPPLSAFKHIPGQDWTLDNDWAAKGFTIEYFSDEDRDIFKNSTIDKLEGRLPLYVQVNPKTKKITCGYYFASLYEVGYSVVGFNATKTDDIWVTPYDNTGSHFNAVQLDNDHFNFSCITNTDTPDECYWAWHYL